VKQGELLYSGKAKSVYQTDEDDVLLVKFRDDITAFDGGKKEVLSEKGVFNARVSEYLFRYLGEHGVKTHLIGMLDRSTMLVRRLEMIPLEVIVRNVAAGSMTRNYPIKEGTPLDPPVIVIDLKDDSRHDPMVNDDLIFALGLATREELTVIKQEALRVNSVLAALFDSLGITLVDFKLEFGRAKDGIYLGDEISMDSMRLWDKKTGESLDKDVFRFGRGDVMEVYRRVSERILS
jgi:phosphoribosylaminoimidazole-succinocarboxamide synthase